MTNNIFEKAIEYRADGYPVFPLVPGDKKPLPATNGFLDATTDFETIMQWWGKTPDANIGMPTGAISGIWVLDIDGQDGESSLQAIEQEHGNLPATYTVETGKGRHLYFAWPESGGIKSKVGLLGNGLDVRAEGGYVVAPPSRHETGREYREVPDTLQNIVKAPDWLIDLIKKPEPKHGETGDRTWREALYGVSEGQRNNAIASIAGKLFADGWEKEEVLQHCIAINHTYNKPPLSQKEVETIVASVSRTDQRNNGQNGDALEVTRMDQIPIKPINWLWPYRIACGRPTVIAGHPGLGKSQVTASLAATVSTGGAWPNGEGAAPEGDVLILSAEDDAADTIKPRLLAAGANMEKCHIIQAVRDNNKKQRTFDLTKDTDNLDAKLSSMKNVKLVIIDPISAYLGKTDSHNNEAMRGVLAPLAKVAEKHDAAFLLVTHFNKSGDQIPIQRVIGSTGLIGAARAGYAVTSDENEPEKRYFVPIKNNVGNDTTGFAFTIEGTTVEEGIETSRIDWQFGTVSAKQILNPEKETKTSKAAEFLQGLLESGPMIASDIFKEAEENGFSESAMRRARKSLGADYKKQGMEGGVLWWLPSSENHEDATPET